MEQISFCQLPFSTLRVKKVGKIKEAFFFLFCVVSLYKGGECLKRKKLRIDIVSILFNVDITASKFVQRENSD